MQRLSLWIAMVGAFTLAACERAEKAAGEEQQAVNAAEPAVVAASAGPPIISATDGSTLQWGACARPARGVPDRAAAR